MHIHWLCVMLQKILHLVIWKIELDRFVYDFSVNYDTTDIDDVLDVNNYLMKKVNIK